MWEFPWKHWSIVWCFKPSHFVNIWVSSFSKSNTIPKPQVVSLLDTSVNELHAFWRNGLNAARPAATNFFFTSLLMTPWIFDKKKENHHQFNVNIEQWTINSCLFNVFFSSLEWFSISSPIESMTHRTWSKNTIMPHNGIIGYAQTPNIANTRQKDNSQKLNRTLNNVNSHAIFIGLVSSRAVRVRISVPFLHQQLYQYRKIILCNFSWEFQFQCAIVGNAYISIKSFFLWWR